MTLGSYPRSPREIMALDPRALGLIDPTGVVQGLRATRSGKPGPVDIAREARIDGDAG